MFSLTHDAINTEAYKRELADPGSGGYVTFEGWVRNHNEDKVVKRLDYEAYGTLALKEGQKILQEACDQFEITTAMCAHRLGSLEIGDCAVWIGVTAEHRGPAFTACEFIINQVKQRVPIWKKEHYVDGDSGWVKCDHVAHHVH